MVVVQQTSTFQGVDRGSICWHVGPNMCPRETGRGGRARAYIGHDCWLGWGGPGERETPQKAATPWKWGSCSEDRGKFVRVQGNPSFHSIGIPFQRAEPATINPRANTAHPTSKAFRQISRIPCPPLKLCPPLLLCVCVTHIGAVHARRTSRSSSSSRSSTPTTQLHYTDKRKERNENKYILVVMHLAATAIWYMLH